jgi:hypothetical protein
MSFQSVSLVSKIICANVNTCREQIKTISKSAIMQEKLDRYEESVHDKGTYSSSNPSNQGILRLGS